MKPNLTRDLCIAILRLQNAKIEPQDENLYSYSIELTSDFDSWAKGTCLDLCFNRFECKQTQIFAGRGSEFFSSLLNWVQVREQNNGLIAKYRMPELSLNEIKSIISGLSFENCYITEVQLGSQNEKDLFIIYFLVEVSCIFRQEQLLFGIIFDIKTLEYEELFELEHIPEESVETSSSFSNSSETMNEQVFAKLDKSIEYAYSMIESHMARRLNFIKRQLKNNLQQTLAQTEHYYQKTKETEVHEKEKPLEEKLKDIRKTLRKAKKSSIIKSIRTEIETVEKELALLYEKGQKVEKELNTLCQNDMAEAIERHQINLDIQILGVTISKGREQRVNLQVTTRLKERQIDLVLSQNRPESINLLCQACGKTMKQGDSIVLCESEHLVHLACSQNCQFCGSYYRQDLSSEIFEVCKICGSLGCSHCMKFCSRCNAYVCPHHIFACETCNEIYCFSCTVSCVECGSRICLDDMIQCDMCGAYLCIGTIMQN